MTRAIPPTRVHTQTDEIALSGGGLHATVRPDLGAKVTELSTLATGRNWLWQNDRAPHRAGSPGSNYVRDFDSGGWDELFPTVGATEQGVAGGAWDGMPLTDHGEVWCRRWETDNRSANTCRVFCESDEPGYRLDRSIRLGSRPSELLAEYKLTNRSDQAMPFVWAAHPIFSVRPGMALHVARKSPVVIESINGVKPELGKAFARWADLLPMGAIFDSGRPLDFAAIKSGLMAKVFVSASPDDPVVLSDGETGERMTVVPADNQLPYIAIWINLGGWAGDGGAPLTNIGIEPTTSAHETTPCENDPKGGRSAAPGEELGWAFKIRFDS